MIGMCHSSQRLAIPSCHMAIRRSGRQTIALVLSCDEPASHAPDRSFRQGRTSEKTGSAAHTEAEYWSPCRKTGVTTVACANTREKIGRRRASVPDPTTRRPAAGERLRECAPRTWQPLGPVQSSGFAVSATSRAAEGWYVGMKENDRWIRHWHIAPGVRSLAYCWAIHCASPPPPLVLHDTSVQVCRRLLLDRHARGIAQIPFYLRAVDGVAAVVT